MSGFNLADILGDVAVPESGTEQIEYLDIDDLRADEYNFYQLSDLDELADNIATIGLQQPIRVRHDGDHYTIISGHRRTAAMRKLLEAGDERFRTVPCIVESGNESEALRKLKLIFANSATRKMTSAETAAQVREVEDLLYKLSEEGYDFPGRMVNHVAEACKVSKTRIGNLKVIEKNLQPCWSKLWRDNKISEDTALAIARLPKLEQGELWTRRCNDKNCAITAWLAKDFGDAMAAIEKITCTDDYGEPCGHIRQKRIHTINLNSWNIKACARCCRLCPDMTKCRDVCPSLKGEVAEQKAAEKAARAAEKQRREEQERPERERIAAFWQRFKEACENAPGDFVDPARFWDVPINSQEHKDNQRKLFSEAKAGDTLPFRRWGSYVSDVQGIIDCADRLGCTTDYLLLRTDSPNPAQAELSDAGPHWNAGDPPKPGLYYAKFEADGDPICTTARWTSLIWQFPHGSTIEADCLGWWPLPEDD